jgi:ABC-type branched-subunit amino acid transport system substrate-binding protein/DNA-binding CsgD family transcriptional regulator
MNEIKFNNCLQRLSNRVREVLQLFLQGHLDPNIASNLHISQNTVRKHIFNICSEFTISNRDDLIELFIKYGRSWVSNSILEDKGCPSNHYFDGIDFNLYIKEGLECFYRFDLVDRSDRSIRSNYEQAIQLFEKAVNSDPTDPIARIFLNNAKAYLKSASLTPLKIGVVVSFLPNDFHLDASKNVLRGVANSQEKLNEIGRDGRFLEVIIADDRNQPNVAIEIAKRFSYFRSLLGVIGHHSSEGTQAALPIYEKNLLCLISPTSMSSNLRNRIFFRTVGSTKELANEYASYLMEHTKGKVIIFYHKNNEYSQTIKNDFEKNFSDRGGEIVTEISINDPYLDIANIGELSTDIAVLFLSSIETNSAALGIVRKISEFRSSRSILLFSTSLPETPTLEKGGAALEGIVLVSPSLTTESEYIQYAKDRWQQPDINWRVVTAYNATQAIIEAIERSTVVTRAATLENLENIVLDVDRTSGFGLSWSDTDARANAHREYSVWQVRHGRFEEI